MQKYVVYLNLPQTKGVCNIYFFVTRFESDLNNLENSGLILFPQFFFQKKPVNSDLFELIVSDG
jgi:hypothetical protein